MILNYWKNHSAIFLFPSIISISSAAAIHYNSTRKAIELSGLFIEHTELREERIWSAGRGIWTLGTFIGHKLTKGNSRLAPFQTRRPRQCDLLRNLYINHSNSHCTLQVDLECRLWKETNYNYSSYIMPSSNLPDCKSYFFTPKCPVFTLWSSISE